MKKVIGVFGDRGQAESAITQLRNEGFSKEISILGKDNNNQSVNHRDKNNETLNDGGLLGIALGEGNLDSLLGVRGNEGKSRNNNQKTTSDANVTMSGGSTDPVTDGSTTGGVIGGLAGLAAGAGMLVIPGIGPLLAAGPIAGALTGAAAGGVAGGLVDWGIPTGESKRYEEQIKQGSVLVSVECSDNKVQKAMDSMGKSGAKEVKEH